MPSLAVSNTILGTYRRVLVRVMEQADALGLGGLTIQQGAQLSGLECEDKLLVPAVVALTIASLHQEQGGQSNMQDT